MATSWLTTDAQSYDHVIVKAERYEKVLVASGEDLITGSVMGAAWVSCATQGTAGVSNTGTGVCVTAFPGSKVKLGTYEITCTVEASGTFQIKDPEDGLMPNATAGTPYTSDQINFSLVTAATGWETGDAFTIAVSEITDPAALQHKLSVSTATDGSQTAVGVAGAVISGSGGAVTGIMLKRGVADQNALTFGSGHTANTVRADLRKVGIDLVPSVTATV